jgi:RNA polymerase sigma-70 factor, ECF subfamily
MPSDPEPDDDALMARYAAGDPRVAAMLAARHLGRVHGLAARMLGDPAEAEDVAQEAMLRLWRIAPRWQPGRAQVSTWLYRVTVNLCIDRQRRRRRVTPLDAAGDPADPAQGAEARLIAEAEARQTVAALGRLPARQRAAILLRHVEGLGNPDVAAALGTSTEAVESLLARGRRALARALAPEGETGREVQDDRKFR